MLKSIWNKIFVDTYYQVESEKHITLKFDKKVFIILTSVCLSLVFIEYFGSVSYVNSLGFNGINDALTTIKNNFTNSRLFSLCYWVFIIFCCYFLLPLMIIKFIFKDKLSDYGLSIKSNKTSYKVYLIFFLFMLPLIIGFSFTDSFQNKYPFYKPSDESLYPNFVIWQCVYLVQFFSLEFFFRGFMLHGIKKQFGFYSIFVMVIPYSMIHFGKPMPETISAIIAGIVLGALSLKSNSIWLGVAIHYSVAITMDLASLWQLGYFT